MPPIDPRRARLQSPQRSYLRSSVDNDGQSARRQAARDASVGIVRNQIENIFQQSARPAQSARQTQTPELTATRPTEKQAVQAAAFAETSHNSPDSPYDRTHERDRTDLRDEQWKHYHSAWQDYYRQYYERYYLGEIYRMHQEADTKVAATPVLGSEDDLSAGEETFHDLRADLLKNVRASAVKVRSSRHFMPFLAAGLTVLLFLFLQYNRIIFANVEAYVSPGNINPANIIVDPNIKIPISDEPRLIIPKINVDVPVVYDTRPDQASQLQAMEKGVAWFGIPGANSRPGQIGNTVLSGHSSNDLFDPGEFKFIFARLEQLTDGDTFYINYQGVRYTYSVTRKEIVKPTDVQKLVYSTDKPVVTLITCVPLGTAQNRLLVTAEQISPNPSEAEQAPSTDNTTEEATMPGNTPSFLRRLFGS
jgi:sortase A